MFLQLLFFTLLFFVIFFVDKITAKEYNFLVIKFINEVTRWNPAVADTGDERKQ